MSPTGRPIRTRPSPRAGRVGSSFVDRAAEAVRSLADRHSGGLVGRRVAMAASIEATMLTFLPLKDRNRPLGLPTAYTSMTEWEHDPSGWRLVRYNDVAHLGGPSLAERDRPHRARREAQQA